MSKAISIENLSKKYIIGHQRNERYVALRDVLMHQLRGILQRILHPLSQNRENVDMEEFWALRDVNIEIEQGDRVGIIGHNGAGKSTLLKILSRITEPTSGKITLNGRVSSLLEVGTGFHPELSGQENIFLNGAILGMRRSEIKRKFDEIVAFAEIEKFLDTPVKRYSSGMYVRLAFAVAAHLEPEILIVDEVLAVGDAQFQKKCLGKMEEVGGEGRTVLFVSHNMSAIQRLCSKAVLMNMGRVRAFGEAERVCKQYYTGQRNLIGEIDGDLSVVTRPQNLPDRGATITKCNILVDGVAVDGTVKYGESISFSVQFHVDADGDYDVIVGINAKDDTRVTTFDSAAAGSSFCLCAERPIVAIAKPAELFLSPGLYSLVLIIEKRGRVVDMLKNVASFEVIPAAIDGPLMHVGRWGLVNYKAEWSEKLL